MVNTEVFIYISLFNVQGLIPKTKPSCVSYIEDVLKGKKQVFICLTETWLKNDDHSDAELNIPGYQIFRADRDFTKRKSKKSSVGRLSGGVVLYIRDDLASSMEVHLRFSNGVVECLVMHSLVHNLCIVGVYRAPDDITGGHRSTAREFSQCLESVSSILSSFQSSEPDIVFLGDFNLPNCDWKSNVCSGPKTEKECFSALRELLVCFGLVQYVHTPTHFQGNTLDLLFLNNSFMLHSYENHEVLRSISHHNIVEAMIIYSLPTSNNSRLNKSKPRPLLSPLSKFNFHSECVDWGLVNENFSQIDWEKEFNGVNVDQITDKFLEVCLDIAYKSNIPLKVRKKYRQNRIPIYRRRLMSQRNRAHKRIFKIGNKEVSSIKKLKKKLVTIEEKLMKSYSDSKVFEENKAIDAIKSNPKFFYAYARNIPSQKYRLDHLSAIRLVISL